MSSGSQSLYSMPLLSGRGVNRTPLAAAWSNDLSIAYIETHRTKRSTKAEVLSADIISIITQIEELAAMEDASFKVYSGLLVGVVRIYAHKLDRFYSDCAALMERMETSQETPRPATTGSSRATRKRKRPPTELSLSLEPEDFDILEPQLPVVSLKQPLTVISTPKRSRSETDYDFIESGAIGSFGIRGAILPTLHEAEEESDTAVALTQDQGNCNTTQENEEGTESDHALALTPAPQDLSPRAEPETGSPILRPVEETPLSLQDEGDVEYFRGDDTGAAIDIVDHAPWSDSESERPSLSSGRPSVNPMEAFMSETPRTEGIARVISLDSETDANPKPALQRRQSRRTKAYTCVVDNQTVEEVWPPASGELVVRRCYKMEEDDFVLPLVSGRLRTCVARHQFLRLHAVQVLQPAAGVLPMREGKASSVCDAEPYNEPCGEPCGEPYNEPCGEPYNEPCGEPYNEPCGEPYNESYNDSNNKPCNDPYNEQACDEPYEPLSCEPNDPTSFTSELSPSAEAKEPSPTNTIVPHILEPPTPQTDLLCSTTLATIGSDKVTDDMDGGSTRVSTSDSQPQVTLRHDPRASTLQLPADAAPDDWPHILPVTGCLSMNRLCHGRSPPFVAGLFMSVLDAATNGRVAVLQDKPFSDVLVWTK
ncbi:MAG: hypothetical protein KVP17_002679 [Porospora cf. gigantea B]|uniref:uncharacterized protein n=2 Tax=Porospora cf. gigantea B TaxID=2853592 RepID=UPI003571B6A9|nr:MAG: hypothetical protein KVP17_002679 [Porospora cf. gigantea B]